MLEKVLAKRYAGALLNLAEKENQVDQIEKELSDFLKLYQETPDLAKILNHPLVSRGKKNGLLNKAIGRLVAPLLLRFIEVLIRKGRTSYLPEIVIAYHTLADAWRGVVRINVKSYYPLSTSQLKILEKKLQSRFTTAKRIVFDTVVDRSLLGGLVIQTGDEVIDGSVTGQLNRLQQELLYRT